MKHKATVKRGNTKNGIAVYTALDEANVLVEYWRRRVLETVEIQKHADLDCGLSPTPLLHTCHCNLPSHFLHSILLNTSSSLLVYPSIYPFRQWWAYSDVQLMSAGR